MRSGQRLPPMEKVTNAIESKFSFNEGRRLKNKSAPQIARIDNYYLGTWSQRVFASARLGKYWVATIRNNLVCSDFCAPDQMAPSERAVLATHFLHYPIPYVSWQDLDIEISNTVEPTCLQQ